MTLAIPPSRLLVVDDNEMNRDMLSRRLQKQGYEVEMAEDGKRALAILGDSAFDLVLLDIMMPEMDGYEVLARIKADEKTRHIPVVMISAVGETESVVRCIELGAEDYLPKPFNPVILRARVGASLDKKKLRDRERLYAESMERELEIGRRIQAGFFPEELPQPEGWEIEARFEPARQVAGDFYDGFPLSDGRILLVVSDVCDKGVGAALYMALFRSLIRAVALQQRAGASSEEILAGTVQATNDYIARTHSRANMFATTFAAILDPLTGGLTYINAGHEAPMVLAGGSCRARLTPSGPALGLLPDVEFGVRQVNLARGETLLAFSDGVTEAKGHAGFYGEERLLAVATGERSAAALLGGIEQSLREHCGGFERSDDITMLAVRRR